MNWKVSKRAFKKLPDGIWMGGHVSVSLSVHVSAFSGPVQLCTSNLWAGFLDQLTSRKWPWTENSLFLENLSPP